MQIVIDIDYMVYEFVQTASFVEDERTLFKQSNADRQKTLMLFDIIDAIRNGTLIPKGHGRIGDLDKVADRLEALRDNWNYYGNEYESGIYTGYDYSLDEVMDAPTIIEADTKEA